MRYVLVVVAALALVVGGAVIVGGGDDERLAGAKVEEHAEGAEGGEAEEEEGLGPAEPDDYFLLQRSRRGALPDTREFRRALRQTRAVRARAAVAPRRWQLVGPTNIGGRIVDVAVDPRAPDTIYAAAATGGVWRSTDAGATLQTAWSDANTQAMGAVAMGRDGTLWAGTGELNPGGGSITFGGTGVFRSTDGGRTWHSRGLSGSGTTGRIAVDPSNPRRIFVAAGSVWKVDVSR